MTKPAQIDVSVRERRWHSVEDLDALINGAVLAARETLGLAQPGDLSIALIGDEHMAQLNLEYRGKDKPTNVLSFPSEGPAPIMGDIALSFETVSREAREKKIALSDHLQHLVIHGYLHLSGYDHETDDDAQDMEALEITALARLGIANPYETLNA